MLVFFSCAMFLAARHDASGFVRLSSSVRPYVTVTFVIGPCVKPAEYINNLFPPYDSPCTILVFSIHINTYSCKNSDKVDPTLVLNIDGIEKKSVILVYVNTRIVKATSSFRRCMVFRCSLL